ncbi:phosphate ABC transporter substrate-binding protein [bacterium]|nr:MAG: phosphate ABC transporter substrate-binding protein [bacterium]
MWGTKIMYAAIIVALIAAQMVTSEMAFAGRRTLVLTGSTTVLPIAQLCAEKFMDQHPDVNISVRGGGSGVGIAALIDGTCDIAMASRPMKTKELKSARGKGINPLATVIAKDGIAIIVHPSNPLSEITLAQLKDIYTGKISNWKDVGGKPGKIVVISRDVASGTFEVFKKIVLKGAKTRADALMLASNKAVATTVEKTPGAIGYVGLGYISSKVKALAVDGVEPTKETVVSGKYKLARPLYLYTDGKPTGLAKEFIDFVLSPEGQEIVDKIGFVPVKPTSE